MLSHLSQLPARKRNGPPLSVLTCYDYPTARLLDEAGLDLLLVGDSLGMVVLGLPDTTGVTMEDMVHHIQAVARGAKRVPLIGDLPYRSYLTPDMAVRNARRLVRAGAHAVKLEGGVSMLAQVKAILAEGIPVVGHIGMLPQSVVVEGGYKKKGRTAEDAARLMADAVALDEAGACACVLESMMPEVAAAITQRVKMNTIGIGAGNACDGQVLVTPDLIGSFPWFRPPFAKARADVAGETLRAVREYVAAVVAGTLASAPAPAPAATAAEPSASAPQPVPAAVIETLVVPPEPLVVHREPLVVHSGPVAETFSETPPLEPELAEAISPSSTPE